MEKPTDYRRLTWQEAEKLLGCRVDRRLSYSWWKPIGNRWQVCQEVTYSGPCSGCHEVPESTSYDFTSAKGCGCHECGYTGRRRGGEAVPYYGLEAQRDYQRNL